jgi:hypothetical protein
MNESGITVLPAAARAKSARQRAERPAAAVRWTRSLVAETPIAFIVGAPRCGTTALAGALRSHPQICFAIPKEPHYFTRLKAGWNLGRVLSDYLPLYFKHWPGPGTMLVDGSTSYLYSDQAIEAILRCFPQARFIVMARNPLEMLPSYHTKMLELLDETEPDLAKAWALQEARAWGEQLPKRCRDWRMLQYRDVARVGARCQALLQRVDRSRVKFLLFDDFAADSLGVYRETLAFLGLPDDGRTKVKRRNAAQLPKSTLVQLMLKEPRSEVARMMLITLRRSQRFKAVADLLGRLRRSNREAAPSRSMSPALRQAVAADLAADVALQSRIFGRDLSHWLDGAAAGEAGEVRLRQARA